MAIERLMLLDQIRSGMYLAANENSQDYRISIEDLIAFIQEFVAPDTGVVRPFVTQYASPSSTGFNIAINALAGQSVHLILTPTTGFAAGAITLPISSSLVDKQEVLLNCTQQVTALTINGNGAGAVTGEPSSLGADDFFRLKYDLLTNTWYRVG